MRIGLRPLYNWAVAQAQKPHAPWLLFFIAFIEPCLIPIPPDALLIPMALAERKKAFRMALIATVGSVLGGIVAYSVGAFAMQTLGDWIIHTYHWQAAFDRFEAGFKLYGIWIILAKGLTPIPFMVVCMASGVFHYPLATFIFAAICSRGGRFLLEATLIYFFGEPIRIFIERHLPWLAFGVLLLILGGFWFVLRD